MTEFLKNPSYENIVRLVAIILVAILFYFLDVVLDHIPNTPRAKRWLKVAKKITFLMMFLPLGAAIVIEESYGIDISDSYSLFAFFGTPIFIYFNFTIKSKIKEMN
ncbi:MAG: hypothetical protein RR565_08140 [Erysipelothrix sp.]